MSTVAEKIGALKELLVPLLVEKNKQEFLAKWRVNGDALLRGISAEEAFDALRVSDGWEPIQVMVETHALISAVIVYLEKEATRRTAWEASVEARLNLDAKRIYLKAALSATYPGGDHNVVNEMLERAGLSYRIAPLSEVSSSIRWIGTEARLKGLLGAIDG